MCFCELSAHFLEVIYRDDKLLVVNKPSGMLVHRGLDKDKVTVSDIVRDELVHKPVHALHRLDRGTSGVLLYALDAETARVVHAEIEAPSTFKRYVALVRGPMLEGCVVDRPVPSRNGDRRVDAVTEFVPLAHKDRWTLVEARPRTGRLHQIRRHLKHLSHPVVGDVRYGKGDINRLFRQEYGLNRLALHALELNIVSDEQPLKFRANLSVDLGEPLRLLGIMPEVLASLGFTTVN